MTDWRHGEHYVVCDRCGFLSCDEDDSGREFLCRRCGSSAAWVYPTIEAALRFQQQVRLNDSNQRSRLKGG